METYEAQKVVAKLKSLFENWQPTPEQLIALRNRLEGLNYQPAMQAADETYMETNTGKLPRAMFFAKATALQASRMQSAGKKGDVGSEPCTVYRIVRQQNTSRPGTGYNFAVRHRREIAQVDPDYFARESARNLEQIAGKWPGDWVVIRLWEKERAKLDAQEAAQ